MYRLILYRLMVWGVILVGCSDPKEKETETLEWADLACSVHADCRIKSVPTCCGMTMEEHPECVNRGYTPPTSVDCSANHTCATYSVFDSCACQPWPVEDDGGAELICTGILSDAGVR